MAFVDYNNSSDSIKLHRARFRSRKDVELKLELLNNSENKLESLNVFIDKLESELSVLALKE